MFDEDSQDDPLYGNQQRIKEIGPHIIGHVITFADDNVFAIVTIGELPDSIAMQEDE